MRRLGRRVAALGVGAVLLAALLWSMWTQLQGASSTEPGEVSGQRGCSGQGQRPRRTMKRRPRGRPVLASTPLSLSSSPRGELVSEDTSTPTERPEPRASTPVVVHQVDPLWRYVMEPPVGDATLPVFAPGGGWLAWETEADGSRGVDVAPVVVGAEATGAVQHVPRPEGVALRAPVWHPDGHLVVESGPDAGVRHLMRWTPAGPAPGALLPDVIGDTRHGAVSPDGSLLAFAWRPHADANPALRLANGLVVNLPFTRAVEDQLVFDGSGTRVAYRRHGVGVVVVDLATRREQAIVAERARGPVAFQGDRLVFVRGVGSRIALFSVPAGGGPERVELDGLVAHPDWRPAVSPDGRWLAGVLTDADGSVWIRGGGDAPRLIELRTGMERVRDPAFGRQGDRVLLAWSGVDPDGAGRRVIAVAEVGAYLGG